MIPSLFSFDVVDETHRQLEECRDRLQQELARRRVDSMRKRDDSNGRSTSRSPERNRSNSVDDAMRPSTIMVGQPVLTMMAGMPPPPGYVVSNGSLIAPMAMPTPFAIPSPGRPRAWTSPVV